MLDLELVDQNFLNIEILPPRGACCQFQFLRRYDSIGNQEVVLCLDDLRRLAALGKGNRQGFAQALDTFLGNRSERSARLVVDELDDTEQFVALRIDNRRHQHLLGAVAGALVDFLQEAQRRIDRLELGLVIDVANIHGLLGQCDMTGDALVGDRQAQILERRQAGLDFRNNGRLVFTDGIDRQAIGIEQAADPAGQFQHDLVDVCRGMYLVGDNLQVLEKSQAAVHIGHGGFGRCCRNGIHSLDSRMPACALIPPSRRVA